MKRQLKKIVIVFITMMISALLHSQIPISGPLTQDYLSFFAKLLSPIGVIVLFFLISYYLIASVFLKFESKLSGSKLKRAMVFGGLVGGVWWVGMIEAVFIADTKFMSEFLTGLFDFIPIVILCILLSVFLVTDKAVLLKEKIVTKRVWINILVFLLVFVGGRVIRYAADLGVHYKETSWLVYLWFVAFALIIALNYIFLNSIFKDSSPIKTALLFAFVIFGIQYAMFTYFIPVIFNGWFIPVTIGFLVDLLLVFIASFIAAKMNMKGNS